MGLFGNYKKEELVDLAKDFAHSANDANKEIQNVLNDFDQNSSLYLSMASDLGAISENIKMKIDAQDMNDLVDYLNKVGEIQKDFARKYEMIMQLSSNQMNRTTYAVNKYGQIKG